MKKLFVILVFLLIVLFTGLFVYFLTLDVNRYKPMLIEKIEESIQKNVRLGNISLNIFPPITISANSISVKDLEKSWDDALLEAGSLNARVKILPLIRKNIEIEYLLIRDMDVLLKDDIKVSIPEAILKNISLYGPIDIYAKLSFFGRGAENAKIKVLLYPEVGTQRPFIKNLELKIDISKIDLVGALEAMGQSDIAREFIGKRTDGELTITSEKIYLDLDKIYNSTLYLDLTRGMIEIPFIEEGFKEINLKAQMKTKDMIIERLTGKIAGGSLSADGWVKGIFSRKAWGFDLALKDIEISRLLQDLGPGKPGLEGRFDIEMDVSGIGLSQGDLISSLAGKGKVNVYEAVLKNINLLEIALDKLDMLPGIVPKLKRRLPTYYKDLLKQDYTDFRPINAKFELREGRLFFRDMLIESDAFYLKGDASLGLDRILRMPSILFMPKDLSRAFIDVADEFGYLQNNQGMITMPLMIYGKLPEVSVMPDLDYVIRRLAVSKGQELLDSIFGRKERKEVEVKQGEDVGSGEETESETSDMEKQGQERQPKPEEVLIRTIFDIISGSRE